MGALPFLLGTMATVIHFTCMLAGDYAYFHRLLSGRTGIRTSSLLAALILLMGLIPLKSFCSSQVACGCEEIKEQAAEATSNELERRKCNGPESSLLEPPKFVTHRR